MYDCVLSLESTGTQVPIEDIHLFSSLPSPQIPLTPGTPLKILAVVSTQQIPLHIVIGPGFEVWTPNASSEQFFSEVLYQEGERTTAVPRNRRTGATEWWTKPSAQSSLGLLVAFPKVEDESWRGPVITEILFYGTIVEQQPRISAQLLSSELISRPLHDFTPPISPVDHHADGTVIEAQFIASPWEDAVSRTVSSARRRQMSDVFDQASERRRKARRNGGEGIVAAAASVSTEASGHRRSTSWNQKRLHADDVAPLAPTMVRPPSRSPSVSSETQPISRKGTVEAKRSSLLSRVTTAEDADGEPSTEIKNKEALSRLVMAGMRLYGMQQSRSSRGRKGSAPPQALATLDLDSSAADVAAKDEDYKLVFHQAYRGACVAFRHRLITEPLYLHPDQLRDTVDKLLAILCTDPLLHSLSDSHATEVAITPAGRPEKHGNFDASFSGTYKKTLTPEYSKRLPVSTIKVRRSPLAPKGSSAEQDERYQ